VALMSPVLQVATIVAGEDEKKQKIKLIKQNKQTATPSY
jgi:hypothetical protein